MKKYFNFGFKSTDMSQAKSIYTKSNFHIAIHCAVWLIILGLPLFFSIYDENRSIHKYMNYMIPMLFAMMGFYINFFLIIPKLLFKRKVWQFFVANIVAITFLVFMLDIVQEIYLFKHMPLPKDVNAPPRIFFHLRNVISLVFMTGLSVSIKMTNRWYKSEAERSELEKSHLESELTHLKSQLNPHFLFNTLNNIYSLIAIDQNNAQNAVHQLSKLLRYVLYDSNLEKVSLEKEVALLKNYIELMSLRLPKHVKVNTSFNIKKDTLVAPLLFISLIENAFKHGVHSSKPSFIEINIESSEDGTISCSVVNSNNPKSNSDQSGSGIGLENLKKRLDLIYPLNHVFIIEDKGDSFYAGLKLTNKN